MFPREDVEEAAALLIAGLPDNGDRVHFAAVRSSAGDLGRLRQAIELGRTDWRDLLMAADFGPDVHAHERWSPQPLDAKTVERWKTGALPASVAFCWKESVSVDGGPIESRGPGVVVSLATLEPEARYVVRDRRGRDVEVHESWLAPASGRR